MSCDRHMQANVVVTTELFSLCMEQEYLTYEKAKVKYCEKKEHIDTIMIAKGWQ